MLFLFQKSRLYCEIIYFEKTGIVIVIKNIFGKDRLKTFENTKKKKIALKNNMLSNF